jgi:hypothetical protein
VARPRPQDSRPGLRVCRPPGSRFGTAGDLRSIGSIRPQPPRHLLRIPIRREHWIEDLLDHAVPCDQRDPFHEADSFQLESGEAEGFDEIEVLIAQQLKGEVQPFDGFLLILRVLGAEAEDCGSEGFQLAVVVAEGAGLGGAAAGSRDVVPAGQAVAVGTAGLRIEIDDGPAGKGREVDLAPGRRRQRDRREAQAWEVIAGAVATGTGRSAGSA